jgi:uncharacterized membrane protein YeaQ/YmgE (transglycosylase-associated protein family)
MGTTNQLRKPACLKFGTFWGTLTFREWSMAAVRENLVTGFLWIVIIGFIAGVIARFLLPGPNNPQGFLLTAVLGIAGAFVSTWIGQSIGWYRPDQGAGIVGATLGAVVVLIIWHRLVVQRRVNDPGISHTNWPPSRP